MDPRLLRLYNRELQHVREMGSEFAREYPKIAGRLGLEGFECADPYVERLLEGFAFVAARVQLKQEEMVPQLGQQVLESVAPHLLAPTPSMLVAQFSPDLRESSLARGFPIPRGTSLRTVLSAQDVPPCEYVTAHDVTLWPLRITEASYLDRDLTALQVPATPSFSAALRLKLETTAGLDFSALKLDQLPIYLQGTDELPRQLYEELIGHCVGVVVSDANGTDSFTIPARPRARTPLRRLGFDDEHALLPADARSFHGNRLLSEYFAFPQRFMFVEVNQLQKVLPRLKSKEVYLTLLLDRAEPNLQRGVDPKNFGLFCTPAINLVKKRADRVHLDHKRSSYHVVPDRTRPLDFEVYRINSVTGFGSTAEQEEAFHPLYGDHQQGVTVDPSQRGSYFVTERKPRRASSRPTRGRPQSDYASTEVWVSLLDRQRRPYRSDLRQLEVETLCTHRDLPQYLQFGRGKTDFTLSVAAPVDKVRCIAGPTRPQGASATGDASWKLTSQLSLNYLSLADSRSTDGSTQPAAPALRQLLELYGDLDEPFIRKQIDGVHSIVSQPITRPLPLAGPPTFGRGLEVQATFDESAFEGSGMFLLGAVLEQFFAQYVSLNSFTETVVRTTQGREVMRWPLRLGRRHML